ncbi:MAG: spore coat protein [Bacilli bacterium]|nr:spore coat protein [Bacilli bacterium]MDD3305338.1 spore coat protein [Bacilli bacterium]MDD4053630.1 spore coat protein [Bacilli bacterium]MDD4411129.1 spore coat protein [Bacilli bacterium]
MDNNSNMVFNPETEVPKNQDMNDCDYLNDFLSTEKMLSGNYVTAMNEASNNELFEEIGNICIETENAARDLFNVQFAKGWYKLEKADINKINTVSQEYNQKLNELS